MPQQSYDFANHTLPDLDGGIFAAQISKAIQDVALGTVLHGKKGKVIVQIDMERIKESAMVDVSHTLKFEKPTRRGKVIEHVTTDTPMHVSKHGRVTIAPDTQESLDFGHQANPATATEE